MKSAPGDTAPKLFWSGPEEEIVSLGLGAVLLRGFALAEASLLLAAVQHIAAQAPFRQMITPGGFKMSVAMTNCGNGWVTDRAGYRYDRNDPISGHAWPVMPEIFLDVAHRAAFRASYRDFTPDACLINRYMPGARLTLHQDKNEDDFDEPIVSVSLGSPAKFIFGGLHRSERPQRMMLYHGDVAVWGGVSRLAYHGIDPLKESHHPETGAARINLTFRRALGRI